MKVVFTAISMLYLICVILMYSSPALREHIIYLNSCKYNIIYICYNIFVRVHPAIVNIIGYPIFFFRIIIRNPVIVIRVNDLGFWEFFGLYFKRLKS